MCRAIGSSIRESKSLYVTCSFLWLESMKANSVLVSVPGISLGISFIQLSHWGPPLATFSSAHASLQTLVIIGSCQVYWFGPYRFSLFSVFSLSYLTLPFFKSHLEFHIYQKVTCIAPPKPDWVILHVTHSPLLPTPTHSPLSSKAILHPGWISQWSLKIYKYLGFIYCIWIIRILSMYLFLYTVPIILATNTSCY